MSDELLRIDGLCAGYGASQVLEDLSFSMGREAVCIVGRNGMGKTTLCKTLMGLLKPSAGAITFAGSRIEGWNPERVAGRGVAYIPQGRRLFPSLTVDEHLAMLAKGTSSSNSSCPSSYMAGGDSWRSLKAHRPTATLSGSGVPVFCSTISTSVIIRQSG